MNITVTVMAHPKRSIQAHSLALSLKHYPFMDVSITWDQQNNEWHTGERALQRGAGQGDWHLVLQDDAILSRDFYTNLEAAIAAVPIKSLISLYVGKVKPLEERVTAAVEKAPDGSWLNFYMLLWGVGVLLPSDHIEPLLDYVGDERYIDSPYDNRIGIFYQRNMLPIYYTMPSLVDHADELGSLLPDHATEQPRVAHRLATSLVNWSDTVIDI